MMKIDFKSPDELTKNEDFQLVITEDDYTALSKSIADLGFLLPIIVDPSGTVIDGNNRLSIAKEMGLSQIPVVELKADGYGDYEEIAIRLNLARRHLNMAQKVALAEKLIELMNKRKEKGVEETEEKEVEVTREDAKNIAKATGISERNVYAIAKVKKTSPELINQVIKGELPVYKAERIASEHAKKQQTIEIKTPEAQLMIDIDEFKRYMKRIDITDWGRLTKVANSILDNFTYLSDKDKRELLENLESLNKIVIAIETLNELQKLLSECLEGVFN